jgi:hypothetical protein
MIGDRGCHPTTNRHLQCFYGRSQRSLCGICGSTGSVPSVTVAAANTLARMRVAERRKSERGSMLTIHWDTLIVVVVIGLTAAHLVIQALVRVSLARLIAARRAARGPNTPDLRVLRRDDAGATRHTPPRREVS